MLGSMKQMQFDSQSTTGPSDWIGLLSPYLNGTSSFTQYSDTSYLYTTQLASGGNTSVVRRAFDGQTASVPIIGTLGTNAVRGVKVTSDSGGNVYIAGAMTTTNLPYVAKLNSMGQVLWQKTYTDTTFNPTSGQYDVVKFSPAGNLIVAGGWFSSGGQNFNVLARLDPATGSAVWTRAYVSSATLSVNSLAFDSSENIYVANDIGTGAGALFKTDSTGAVTWARRIITNPDAVSYTGASMAVNSAGNVALVARSGSNRTMGLSLTTIDTTGNVISSTRYWNPSFNTYSGTGIVYDSADNAYFVGAGYIGDTLGNTSDGQVFIIKFDPTGTITNQQLISESQSGANLVLSYGATPTITSQDRIIINAISTKSPANDNQTFSLPIDGSATGTYTLSNLANVVYSNVTSFTSNASNLALVTAFTSATSNTASYGTGNITYRANAAAVSTSITYI